MIRQTAHLSDLPSRFGLGVELELGLGLQLGLGLVLGEVGPMHNLPD